MGKSTPQMPTAPDPTQVAAQQQQYNQQNAIQNAELNRINQYGPQGSLTYQQVGTNPDGTPQYSQTLAYSPQQQQLYNTQLGVSNALSDTASQAIGRVQNAMSTPFNFNNMAPLQTGYSGGGTIQQGYNIPGNVQTNLDFSSLGKIPQASDFAAQGQQVNNAVYNQATSRLDPQWNLQQQQLQASLAAKGVTEGSTAYQNAMDQFQRQKTDAYNQAQYSGIQQGAAEQAQLFGMGLQARQQGVAEITGQGQFANQAQAQQAGQAEQQAAFGNTAQAQANQQAAAQATFANQARAQQEQEASYLRNLPLSDVSSLIGQAGGVGTPQFGNYSPVAEQGVNYAGLVQNNYNDQMQAYNTQVQQQSSALGSIFGTLGSLGSAAITHFSDRRLKTDIKVIGELYNGIKTYVFRYLRDPVLRIGVMADEVISVRPEAVSFDPSGYMMVDYGRIM